MAEIDTGPHESIQAALPLFEQIIDQNNSSSASNGEVEKEKELQLLMELTNRKVQLEIKESATMQTALQLDSCCKIIEELSTKLKYSKAERDRSMEDCQESYSHMAKPESVIKVTAGQETQKRHMLDELKALKEERVFMKSELTAAEELNVAALRHAELMKTKVLLEQQNRKELLMHILELNQAILLSILSAVEAEKERHAFYCWKEAEMQVAKEAVILSHKQLEGMKRQFDMMKDWENELLQKIMLTDYLELELKQAKELCNSSSQVASYAMSDLTQLRSEMAVMDRLNSENMDYIMFMEAEVKRMEEELQSAREYVNDLDCQVKILMTNMQNLKDDMSKITKRDLELEVEIANLKSELHKGRPKIAAAEAGEARPMSAQAGLFLTVQQQAREAMAGKNETERLTELRNAEAETEVNDDASTVSEGRDFVTTSTGFCSSITISTEDYEALLQKAEKADRMADSPLKDGSQSLGYENKCKVDILKEELEASNAIISDLRFSLEEATRRAELSEQAKAAIEDQLRKWRVKQQQRRAASEMLPEQSTRKHTNYMMHEPSASRPPLGQSGLNSVTRHAKRGSSMCIAKNSKHVPLGKILNMKF